MAAFKLADPTFGDPVYRHRIDEVQFLAAGAPPGNQVRFRKDREMLRDSLARHIQPLAQLAKRLAVFSIEPVQQLPAACIGQGAKNSVVILS